MLNNFIIQGEKGKNVELAHWSKFWKKNWIVFRYLNKLSKYPKILPLAQKMREEIHFEIYKSEPYTIPIRKSPRSDRHPLKTTGPLIFLTRRFTRFAGGLHFTTPKKLTKISH